MALVLGPLQRKARQLIPPLPRQRKAPEIVVTKYLTYDSSLPVISCLDESRVMQGEERAKKKKEFLSSDAHKVLQEFKRH